jgi:3-methylfumaryl-CoA hydratase
MTQGLTAVPIDEQFFEQWIGRQECQRDVLTCVPLNALAATLDREDRTYTPAGEVPLLWHWLYFLPLARQSAVGPDGHPLRGGFLPPITLPRRMWAGSRLSFEGALPIGAEVERTSTILDVTHKTGRSGSLIFVKLLHELAVEGQVRVREEQDIVYRDAPSPNEPAPRAQPAPTNAQWTRELFADPVLLFRYSALTFNGHRIHYDRPYAIQEEGYPGLVVHGPLIATLLMNLLRDERPSAKVTAFSFRALRPIFDQRSMRVCGCEEQAGRIHLWAEDADGYLCMDAWAELA